jgi:Fic family protein
MERGLSGQYETRTLGGETVRAFVPSPLPPAPPIRIEGELARLHEKALLACGRLDAVTTLLPEPDLFIYAYVRREALLSSQIEGTQSSISDLLRFEAEGAPGAPFNEVAEVSNYVSAMEHGLTRIRDGFPLSNRLLREMHGRLLARGRGADLQPGEFRTTQNWIGGTRPGNAAFVPAPPDMLQDGMAALEQFLHDPNLPFSALVRAALAHVQIETLHPFLDGNGRMGRLLIALILHTQGILQQPLLYLSLFLKQHRAEYYQLLDQCRFQGDWERWLAFFLEGVKVTAEGAVETANRLMESFADDATRIRSLGRASGNALQIFEQLKQRPVMGITDIADRAGVAFQTASRAVSNLEELGVVEEITGRKRDRIYAYGQYLAILSEGAEPL